MVTSHGRRAGRGATRHVPPFPPPLQSLWPYAETPTHLLRQVLGDLWCWCGACSGGAPPIRCASRSSVCRARERGRSRRAPGSVSDCAQRATPSTGCRWWRRAHCRRRLGRGCRGRGDGRLGADQLGAPGGRRRYDPRAVGGHGPLPPTSGRLTGGERGRTGSDRLRGTFVLTIGPRRPKASSRRARYSSSKRHRKAMVY